MDLVADGGTIQRNIRLQGGNGGWKKCRERRKSKGQERRKITPGDLGEKESPPKR